MTAHNATLGHDQASTMVSGMTTMTTDLTWLGDAMGPTYVSPLQVFLGAIVIIVNAVISLTVRLGIHWSLLIGTVRCVVQLTLLGYILVPIFTYQLWYLVIGCSFFMLLVGSWEASSRPSYSYKGFFLHVTGSIAAAASVFICYTLLLVVRSHPWWQAQYFIPILGMIFGNAVSGVSVGLSTLFEEFVSGRERIELLLAIGSNRWEATREAVAKSLKVACMPIINQMNVVGLVSIPGMMTGQILAGSDPSQAARYQMIVLFVIATSTSVSSLLVILLAAFHLVDGDVRLRSDRLTKRGKKGSWINAAGLWIARVCAPCTNAIERTYKRLTQYLWPPEASPELPESQQPLIRAQGATV